MPKPYFEVNKYKEYLREFMLNERGEKKDRKGDGRI